MKKKFLLISLLMVLFIAPAASLEMGISGAFGADLGVVRSFPSENIAFNIKLGPIGLDAGFRFVENFKKSSDPAYRAVYVIPNATVYLGSFYLGYGIIINAKSYEQLLADSVFKSGYLIDILDLEEYGKIGIDCGLEFSMFGIFADDDAGAGEKALVFSLGNIFNMIKLNLNLVYTYRF